MPKERERGGGGGGGGEGRVSVYEFNCSVYLSLFLLILFSSDIAVPSVVVFVGVLLGTVFVVICCVTRGRCCRCRRTPTYRRELAR